MSDYIETDEDKTRRKVIRVCDKRQVSDDYTLLERCVGMAIMALRQGSSFYQLVHGKVKERSRMLAVAAFLVGVWLSGFFAHAGMKFESLLALVGGVIVAMVLNSLNNPVDK